jgi:osmotically-inducible protein OsmY
MLRVLAAAPAAIWLGGCAPLVIGGAAVGAAMVGVDRRTAGTQLEDQEIEHKINREIDGKIPQDFAHVNATSYNRKVLLTGEVTTEQYKAEAERLAKSIENVRLVFNELVIAAPSGMSARTTDTAITTKVITALTTAKDVPSGTLKVVTEREVVYLMGRVTEAEGNRAAKVAVEVSGIKRVVKLFDYLTNAELTSLQNAQAPTAQKQ